MTCSEAGIHLHDGAGAGTSSLPNAVGEHLKSCVACRAIWDFLARREPAAPVPAPLQTKITDTVLASLEPVVPLMCAWKLTLGFVLIFGVISGVFVALSGLRGTADAGTVSFTALLGTIGVAVFLLSIVLTREMAPGTPRLLTPARLFITLFATILTIIAVLFPWETGDGLFAHTWHCFRSGAFFSVPAAILIVLLLRRGAVLSMEVAGAGAGLLAGLAGMTVLHFGCTIQSAPHIMIAHFGIATAGALVGFLSGRYLQHFSSRADAA
jgi:hypothetical protein